MNEEETNDAIPFNPHPVVELPTREQTIRFALTDRQQGESDEAKAARAEYLGNVYFDLLQKAQRGIDPSKDDSMLRAEAVYFTQAMTGQDDVYGRLWKKGGFKTGREYLEKMHDFFLNGGEKNLTKELKEFQAKSYDEQVAEAMAARGTLDTLKHAVGYGFSYALDWLHRADTEKLGHEKALQEDIYKRQVRAEYAAKLMADNAWHELSAIMPTLSADGQACAKALMDSKDNRLPETMWAKFNNLEDQEKSLICRVRTCLAPRVEGSFANAIGDMAIGAANVAANVAAAPWRFGNKIGMLISNDAFDAGFDVNELARRRQYLWQATGSFMAGGDASSGYLPQMQFEQMCQEHGFLAESLIGAVSTLPYMAAAAVPGIGVATVAMEAMSEMDDHVAMSGGDITDPDYMFSNALFGAMYAYTERLQVEGLLGGVKDIELRQAMLKGFWSGVKDAKAVRTLTAGTLAESLQEGVQNGIMAANEALALDQDATKAFAEGFTQDFLGSLGTMLVVEGGGIGFAHWRRSGFNNPFSAAGREAGREARSLDLETEYEKDMSLDRMVEHSARSEELRGAMGAAEAFRLYRTWESGGKEALVKAGIDPVSAEEWDYFYSSTRDGVVQDEETGEAAPDVRWQKAQQDIMSYLAHEASKRTKKGEEADLAAFDLAMENLDWVRSAWSQGAGIHRTDEEGKVQDPGAKALEELGFTKNVAKRLSEYFHMERSAAYSPAALNGIKARYDERMAGKVTAKAALAQQFGGQLTTIDGADYLQFTGKDGGINLVRIDETPGGIDFAEASEGVAIDVERATDGKVTKQQWMDATEDERKRIWNDYGLLHEGSFRPTPSVKVTLSADPSVGIDSAQAATVVGAISLDSQTDNRKISDTSAAFHEVYHAFSTFAQASGLWTKEDIAFLEKTFGKAKHSQETHDEESGAEGFRSFLARRANGALTVEDERSPFMKIYAAAAGLDARAKEKAAQEKVAGENEKAFFDQLIAEANKPKPKPPAPKPDLPKTAAPQRGIKPGSAEEISPPETPENKGENAQMDESAKAEPKLVQPGAPKTWSAYTPTGNVKVSGHWAVLDLKDVVHSNNPLYAVHMRAQLRNRKDNKAEEDTRKDIVNNFQGERLLDAPDTANGAPIVFYDDDGTGTTRPFVLSGNGRVLVLSELADRHLYDHYRNVMKKWAAANGIAVPDGQTPILVRVIDDYGGATRDKVADLSNTNSIQQYTEEEQARADAEVIKALGLARLYQANVDGTPDMTPGANDEFFSEFIRGVGDTSLYNSDRSLTQTARDRAQRALLAIAVGQGDRGRDVVKKLVEQTETLGIQRQKNAAAIMAAPVAALESNAAYAIGPDVSRAMADFMDFAEKRKAGKVGTFKDYYDQMDLIDKPSYVARELLALFGSDQAAATIAEYVRAYCKAAAMEDPAGGLFGAARTKDEIWNDAKRLVDDDIAKQQNAARHSISGVYTGSAADYEKPSFHAVGTGEGSQVYGWGLYGSTVRGIAEGYMQGGVLGRGTILVNGKAVEAGDESDAASRVAKRFGWQTVRGKSPTRANVLEATREELAERREQLKRNQEREPNEDFGYIEGWISDLEEDVAFLEDKSRTIEWANKGSLYEQTFFTDRAPGDESHLLKWYEPVTKEQAEWIFTSMLPGHGNDFNKAIADYIASWRSKIKAAEKDPNAKKDLTYRAEQERGEDLYRVVEEALGSPKAASEFLARAGIDGVKYPVDSYGKTVKDGDKAGWNYVSFRDDNIRVDHKWTDGQQRFSVARREYDDVVRRYTNRDGTKKRGWMKAPNGKPTRLTERQWVQVRTPSFKKWFGDWEANALLTAMENLPPIAVTARDGGITVEAAYAAIGDSENAIDGRTVRFVNSSLGKILRHKGYPTERIVHQLGEIFEKSVPIGFSTEERRNGHKEHRNFVGYHNYVGKISDGGKDYYVRITVQELKTRSKKFNPNEFHSSFVSDVELYSKTDALALDTAKGAGKVGAVGFVDGIISNLLDRRNSASKIADENGEPLVVYRGAEFDPLAQEPGKGVIKPEAYFTANPGYAERYKGENGSVRTYYLNIRHPFDIRDPECAKDFASVYPGVKLAKGKSGALDWAEAATVDGEFLKENFGDKYDGIIFDEASDWAMEGNLPKWRGLSYVPLDGGAQVKSATDNNGDFSGNPDVRYSVAARPAGRNKSANVSYPDAGEEISSTRFSVGAKRRDEYARILAKHRPDLRADAVLDELDKYDNPKKEKLALHWLVRGTIWLPNDEGKVDQAIEVAEKAKVDPFKYASPLALIDAHADIRPTEKRIDPATVPELTDARDEGNGVVSYAVADTREGQAAMRRIIDTHWGKDANPWCLVARDKREPALSSDFWEWMRGVVGGRGEVAATRARDRYFESPETWEKQYRQATKRDPRENPDELTAAWGYWNNYNALPKRVAFKDGKLLAFMATDRNSFDDMSGNDIAIAQDRLFPEWRDGYNEWEREAGRDAWRKNYNEWLEENHPDWREELYYALEEEPVAEKWWDRQDESHIGHDGLMEIAGAKDGIRHSISGVYTGSAADYEKPSLHAVGTGEGSQVYGWGLYGSTERGVAEVYANLGGRISDVLVNGERHKAIGVYELVAGMLKHGDAKEFIKDTISALDEMQYALDESGKTSTTYGIRTINQNYIDKRRAEIKEAQRIINDGATLAKPGNVYEQTWFTNRALGDESHLLKWYEPVSEEQLKWVRDQANKEGLVLSFSRKKAGKTYTGGDLYKDLEFDLGGIRWGERVENPMREASEFLYRAGIDGVKYPVDSYGKTVKDGDKAGWNYVSFRDDNIRVDHKWTDGQMRYSIAAPAVANPDVQVAKETAEQRYSVFAGEKMAAPRLLKPLAEAKAMLGDGEYTPAVRRRIYDQTGWWKGTDGKWRVELPNLKPKYFDADDSVDFADSDLLLEKYGWNEYSAYWLRDLVTFPKGLKAGTFELGYTLVFFDTKEQMKSATGGEDSSAATFVQIGRGFFGPEVNVEIHVVDPMADERERNGRQRLAQSTLDSITHELQHVIQLREGFAFGGNMTDAGSVRAYGAAAGEVEARNAARRNDPDSRVRPPWETEDVPTRYQSVGFSGWEWTDAEGWRPMEQDAELSPAAVRPAAERRHSISTTADIEADARRAISASIADGDKDAANSALENYVAYFKLAHGSMPRPMTLARIGLSLGMNVVDPKRIIKNAEKLAEQMKGTVVESASQNGDVATAMSLIKREKDIGKKVENLIAGSVELGGKLTHKGVGKINSLLQKRVESMMRNFTAASLADMEGDTGIDIAAEIIENDPDAFETEYRRAKKAAGENETAEDEGKGESGQGAAAAVPFDESELSDADRYKREILLKEQAERVARFIEAAKRRAEENGAKAAEARERRRVVELEGGGEEGGGEEGGQAAAGSSSDKWNPKPKDVKANFKTPEEFAAFLRVWARDKYAKTHGIMTLGKVEQDRLFAEYYRLCVRKELQDLADKLLAPKMENAQGELVTNQRLARIGNGARVWVNRRIADLEKGMRPDTIERASADIFAFINKAAIRVSRVDLITTFKQELKERFLEGAEFDEFKQDTERKLTGWLEEATRYIIRVCDLSRKSVNGDPSQLEEEYRKLHDIIDKREKVYDESGRDIAEATKEDAETRKAQWKLALLDKYGAMRSLMPGQILDLQNAAFDYLENEARKLEDAWRETREDQDRVRRDFSAAIIGPDGQRYDEKKHTIMGWISNRFLDSLNGMIRLRLEHLTRFADADARAKAQDAINSVLVKLGDGEVAYARALQGDREAFFAGLGQIFKDADGKPDNKAIKKYLERMDKPIPVELSRQLSNQGYAESMTYGQMLQLLVSLEQRSFKDTVEENGREGQAELIRTFRYRDEDGNAVNAFTKEDDAFVDMLRAFYAAKRDQLSEVTERMVGQKVDSPDPLYCPIRRWMDDKARDLHADPTQRWDPISKIFSRRVPSTRDFDESRTIVGLFFENSKESAKLTAWAERGSFIRNVVTSVAFQGAVKRAFGPAELSKILKQLEATFNGGEQRSQTPGEVAAADKAVNFTTYAYLGFNPLSALKQTTSFAVWANQLPNGFADLWRHMTHFDAKALKHLMESEEYKVRYGNAVGSGMDYATKGVNMNPSQNPVTRALAGAGLWMLKRGDFIPGGWIAQGVYKDLLDKHLKDGMGFDEADRLAITETFNMLEETQQSGRTYNTNMLQIEHGRIGRLLTQFATSPLQQLQYETQAWREWRDMVRYQMGDKKIAEARAKFRRAVVINHVIIPAAMNLVIALYKAALGEEPPWEKDGYHWTLLIDMLLGQFSRVFFLGAFATSTLNALLKRESPRFGQMLPIEGAQGMAASGAFLVHDLATMNVDKLQKDIERAIKSTAPTRIPYSIYRRVTGDSDADRKAKKEAQKRK